MLNPVREARLRRKRADPFGVELASVDACLAGAAIPLPSP